MGLCERATFLGGLRVGCCRRGADATGCLWLVQVQAQGETMKLDGGEQEIAREPASGNATADGADPLRHDQCGTPEESPSLGGDDLIRA